MFLKVCTNQDCICVQVSGVNLYVYWFSTYIWDLCNFFLICTCACSPLLSERLFLVFNLCIVESASCCRQPTYQLALKHQSTAVCSMLVMLAFREENYVGTAERALCMLVLMMLYGAASIALSYVMSFMFNNHSAAQVLRVHVYSYNRYACMFFRVLCFGWRCGVHYARHIQARTKTNAHFCAYAPW